MYVVMTTEEIGWQAATGSCTRCQPAARFRWSLDAAGEGNLHDEQEAGRAGGNENEISFGDGERDI